MECFSWEKQNIIACSVWAAHRSLQMMIMGAGGIVEVTSVYCTLYNSYWSFPFGLLHHLRSSIPGLTQWIKNSSKIMISPWNWYFPPKHDQFSLILPIGESCWFTLLEKSFLVVRICRGRGGQKGYGNCPKPPYALVGSKGKVERKTAGCLGIKA